MFGLSFVQQHPMGRWVLDFWIESLSLVVEVHGAYWHDKPARMATDARKRMDLRQRGLFVLELRTDQIHKWWSQLTALGLKALDS